MIYLIIAREGDYSDKHTWVVKALTDEATAVEEAARLNAAIPILAQLRHDYYVRWEEREEELRKNSRHLSHFDQLIFELGPEPEFVDDYTVVAVPLGERGKWCLP